MVLAERRAENKAAAVSAGVSAPPPPPPPAVPTVLAPPVVAIPPGPIPKAQAKAGGVAFKRKSTMRLLAKVTPKKGGLRPSTPIGKNRAKRAKKGVATRVVKSPARKTLRRLLRGQKGKAKAFPAERSAEEAADHEDADEDAEEEEDPGWFVNFEHSTTALSFGPGATHSWS